MSNVNFNETELESVLMRLETIDEKFFSNFSAFNKLLKRLVEEGFVSGKVHSHLNQIQYYSNDTSSRFSGSCYKSAKSVLESYIRDVKRDDRVVFGLSLGLGDNHDYSEGTVSSNLSVLSSCDQSASQLQNSSISCNCESQKIMEIIGGINNEINGYSGDVNKLIGLYSRTYQLNSDNIGTIDSETSKKLSQIVSNLTFVNDILTRLFSLVTNPAVFTDSGNQFHEQLSEIIYDRYFNKDGSLKDRAISNLTSIFTKDRSELSATDVQYVNDILQLINKQKEKNPEAYVKNIGDFISTGYINNYRESKPTSTYNGVEISLANSRPTVVTMEDIGRMALNCECRLSTSFVGMIGGIMSANSNDNEFLDTLNILESVIEYKSSINITHTLGSNDVHYTGKQIPKQGTPVIPTNVLITGMREYTAIYAVDENTINDFYSRSKAKVTVSYDAFNRVYTIKSNEATNGEFSSRIVMNANSPSTPQAVTNAYHDYEIYVGSTAQGDSADHYYHSLKEEELIDAQSTSFNLAKEITKELVGTMPGGSTFINLLEEDYASVGTKVVKTGVSKISIPTSDISKATVKASVNKSNTAVNIKATTKVPYVGDVISSAAGIYMKYDKSRKNNIALDEAKTDLKNVNDRITILNGGIIDGKYVEPTFYTIRGVRDNYDKHGNGCGKLCVLDICTFEGIK